MVTNVPAEGNAEPQAEVPLSCSDTRRCKPRVFASCVSPPASALRTTHTPISVYDLSSMRTRSDARVAAHDRAHTNTPSNTLVCATRHNITLARHTTDTYITHRTRLSASRTSNNSRAEVTAHMSERTRLRANCLHTLPHPSARSPRDLREIESCSRRRCNLRAYSVGVS